MNLISTKEEKKLVGYDYLPTVSIILPFDPKMVLREDIECTLRAAIHKVNKRLIRDYSREQCKPILQKLEHIVQSLNYTTHKKSIAIFVSPLVEKIFYLDISVEEKIVIDEAFEIRDLVYCKKQTFQYLIFLIDEKSSRMYLGNTSGFILIKSNLPDQDPANLFFHHMEEGLSLILQAFPLPVFVLGTKEVVVSFRKITKNENSIVAFIHGEFEKSKETELREVMHTYVEDWRKIKEQAHMQEIANAAMNNKLACGIRDVWSAALHRNGKLLIVEKDFTCPALPGNHTDRIISPGKKLQMPFYIRDAVDDVIEKVLESGGDVEFINNGLLTEQGRIVLIRN